MILSDTFHLPVLLPQVIESLKVVPGKRYIDATIGGGGYAIEITRRGGVVLGIDRDRDALEYVKRSGKLEAGRWKLGENLFLEHGNFGEIKKIAEKYGFTKAAGIIFDLGMSSYQLEKSDRGFSFQKDEPLDMRMNKEDKITAADIINTYSQVQLYEIFSKFAEELHSRSVAQAIFRARTLKGPIVRTRQLVEIIGDGKDRQRTSARIFQALRIAVNNELNNLKKGLREAIGLLEKGGRITVLSYHSLEDRNVKFTLKEEKIKGTLRIITNRPIRADVEEIELNPKAACAKLRIAEKYE